ncbi:MAG: RDD family protein [Bacillota bacterium]
MEELPRYVPERVRGLRGFGLRAAALLIDMALIAGLDMLVGFVLAFVWLAACAPAGAIPEDAWVWMDVCVGEKLDFLFAILGGAYFVGCTAKWGQTAGKRVLGIRVVREDGGPVGFGRALLRETLARWAAGLVLGLGYLWAAWDAGGQGWHDKVAGTAVVRGVVAPFPEVGVRAAARARAGGHPGPGRVAFARSGGPDAGRLLRRGDGRSG